ncbi:ATP-binding protein [Hydrocarboniphaga sp.]|uniref:ATP-binding protein n=1 Tax=Hydrocarboniphaga sp. TaxID=2033016 RepID=UPI003D0DC9E1
MRVCSQCQASNPAQARFCNQCGNRLDDSESEQANRARRRYTPPHLSERVLTTRAAMIGERKRVTVLFVDIKGSTRLAEQAGAEAWHQILNRYFALLGAAVHRYDGTINQYTGDGIMALFGAPLALEAHASSACFAALEIQRTVRDYADELRLSTGLNLSFRAGLNTGDVVVGAIGDDLRMDYTAQGLTVHLAARMEQICEPGRIYATRNTALLAEGYFRLRDLGDMRVAGSEAPVRVFEVEGEGPSRTRLERGLARGATRLVGRDAERQQLRDALAEMQGGRGNIVAVIGEAGIGKSRLCHEFAQDCERAGVAVHRVSGVPYATAVPFLPVQALVRQRLRGGAAEGDGDLRQLAAGALLLFDPASVALLPRLLEFLGEGERRGADAAAGFAADRRQLFELMARLLSRSETPQLLLIEDVHFFDEGSLAFLQLLAAQIAGTSTLLLLNFRPGHDQGWLHSRPERRIALSALGPADIDNLAQQLLGPHPSVAALPLQLQQRAGGNPYFVEEAVQSLCEAGHLQGRRGAYLLDKPIVSWTIPDTVHALIAARVDRLADADKSLLQSASIIGLEFDESLLQALSGANDSALADSLLTLRKRGFIVPLLDTPGRYEFAHPLSQDVVYRTQLESQRVAAHGLLAQQLEQQHPLDRPADEAAPAIAHHWRRARQWLRAAEWNLQAARAAATLGANAALAQFRLAIRNLEQAPRSAQAERMRVQALAGIVRQAQFTDLSTDEVENAYRQASELARASQDTAAQAELLISYSAEQLHRGDAQQAIQLVARAMQLAVDSGALDLINRFRLQLLLVHSTAGYPREGVDIITRTGGDAWLTEPVGRDNYLSRAFYALMLGWLGQLAQAQQQLHAVLAYAGPENRIASWMHGTWIDLAQFTGDYDGVIRHGELAMQRAEETGSSYFRAIALRGLGQAHVLAGDPQIAVGLLEQALPLVARGANGYQFQPQVLATLSRAYRRAGDLPRALATAESSIDSAYRSHARVWEILSWLAYLEIPEPFASRGRAEQGLERVEQLIAGTGAIVAEPWLHLMRMRWSEDPEQAAAHRERAVLAFTRIGARAALQRLASR